MKKFLLVMYVSGAIAWTYLAVVGFRGELYPATSGIACAGMAVYSVYWALDVLVSRRKTSSLDR